MRTTVIATLAASLVAFGCTSSAPGPSATAPGGHHYFEGFASYRGLEGAPPGRPWEARFAYKGDSFRCDITMQGTPIGALGFHGPSQSVCFQPTGSPHWISLNLATIGWLFSMLPPSLRRNAIAEAQARYRWTGRTDRVLGRPCRELEIRSEESTEYYCYSTEEYFLGNDRLVPVARQMGYDNTFLSSMAEGGIGWRGVEFDKNGVPKISMEVVAIDPRPVDPALVANVCMN